MLVAAGDKASSAGTNTLPAGSLYSPANDSLRLWEVGAFNTTATQTEIALQRLTTAGTQGTGLAEIIEDGDGVIVGTAFNRHSVGPTITAGFVRYGMLGAQIGAGIIWTFARGLYIPKGTGNGVGLTVPAGTGQIWTFYFVWEE